MSSFQRSDLDRLQSSYHPLQDNNNVLRPDEDEDEDLFAPQTFQNIDFGGHGDRDDAPGDIIIHKVPEGNKSRWSHIDDLDSFFKKIYEYHQKHGFTVMILQEVCALLQFAFIVFLSTTLAQCVDYKTLFHEAPLKGATGDITRDGKVSLSDCIIPMGQCVAGFTSATWILLLLAFAFFCTRCLATVYHFFQYWDIKAFYNEALKISDSELDSTTWHEIQRRVIAAQKEYSMCIHKEQLTELDIYHRILRFKNYMVAMVNKDILPVRLTVPFLGEKIFFSHGLKFNLEFIFFKGPWAPFDQWHLKDDYKRPLKKKELIEYLQSKITIIALINFFLMPLILLWQVLYCFFTYAELIKREPHNLGVRKWSHYARIYLRHFNELDHELTSRLNRAYKPANKYMDLFISPVAVVLARNVAFMAGAILAVFVALASWDEDVLTVEHVLFYITILGTIFSICLVFIPKDNMVFCPEMSLSAVMAHIHYFPDTWKMQAHTPKVMSQVGELFPYTAVYLLHEVLSPIVTPFILYFSLRPKASAIVDFFRHFTVDVVGVGDVCSFAQMDVRKHGNRQWQNDEAQGGPDAQAEHGKTEMSLVHFALTNPEWRPPAESENFIVGLRDQATKEAETLPTVVEENATNNALFNSLNSLDAAGGIYSTLASNIFQEAQLQRNQHLNEQRLDGGDDRESTSQFQTRSFLSPPPPHSGGATSLMQSVSPSNVVGLGLGGVPGRTSSIFASSHLPGQPTSLLSSRLVGTNASTLHATPNVRQDLRRIGLEYSEADVSLSLLLLHELHYRSSASRPGGKEAAYHTSRQRDSGPEGKSLQRRASLNELDEESLPLIDTSSTRLASSNVS